MWSVNYTEELLMLHDAELVKLREYQEKARPLLDALEKWEKNWALFQDFEVCRRLSKSPKELNK